MIQNTLEIAFLNENDLYATQLKENIKIDKFTYQTQGYHCKSDIRFENEKFKLQNNQITTTFDLLIKEKKYKISTNLIGKPNY
jgi:UDP-N-acetylmuramyl tripeptide synthase